MPADVTRDEFRHLEGRVSVVEREVEGEKMVTRHILAETRRNSDDLAAIKSRLDRLEVKVDGLDQKVDALMKNLPGMIGDVMREVMRESSSI